MDRELSIEVGTSDGSEKSLRLDEGISYSDNVVSHAQDVGANYFSLWNLHRISAAGLQRYYAAYPKALDGWRDTSAIASGLHGCGPTTNAVGPD